MRVGKSTVYVYTWLGGIGNGFINVMYSNIFYQYQKGIDIVSHYINVLLALLGSALEYDYIRYNFFCIINIEASTNTMYFTIMYFNVIKIHS